jgi:hypothetical protein
MIGGDTISLLRTSTTRSAFHSNKASIGWMGKILVVIFDCFFGVKSKLITPLFEGRGMVD